MPEQFGELLLEDEKDQQNITNISINGNHLHVYGKVPECYYDIKFRDSINDHSINNIYTWCNGIFADKKILKMVFGEKFALVLCQEENIQQSLYLVKENTVIRKYIQLVKYQIGKIHDIIYDHSENSFEIHSEKSYFFIYLKDKSIYEMSYFHNKKIKKIIFVKD